MLSPRLLDLLRDWWLVCRSRGWLFPGRVARVRRHCSPVTFWFFERIEFQFANNATMASIIAESNQETKVQIPEIATSRPLDRRGPGQSQHP